MSEEKNSAPLLATISNVIIFVSFTPCCGVVGVEGGKRMVFKKRKVPEMAYQ